MKTTRIKLPKVEEIEDELPSKREERAMKIVEIIGKKWNSIHLVEIKREWSIRYIEVNGKSNEIDQLELLLNASVYSKENEIEDYYEGQEFQNAKYDA